MSEDNKLLTQIYVLEDLIKQLKTSMMNGKYNFDEIEIIDDVFGQEYNFADDWERQVAYFNPVIKKWMLAKDGKIDRVNVLGMGI